MATPLFIFFEKAYAFGEHVAVHIIRITAKEVVHETPERTFTLIFSIDVENMSAIVEYILSILEGSAHRVERFPTFPYVMLRDKDDVGLRQIGEECSLADLTRIDHAAVEPRSTGNCPLVAALDLHIVNGLAIGRKCVESYGTSIEIRHTLLRDDLRHAQTVIAQHSTKHDLHAGDIPVEATIKEALINSAQPS